MLINVSWSQESTVEEKQEIRSTRFVAQDFVGRSFVPLEATLTLEIVGRHQKDLQSENGQPYIPPMPPMPIQGPIDSVNASPYYAPR
jgi:hypothetical protein